MGVDDPYDFPFLSMTPDEGMLVELGREDGDAVTYDEDLFKESSQSCRPEGGSQGLVTIKEERTAKAGRVRITATFQTGDGESVTVIAVVPKDQEGKLGPGKGGMSGGTGKWRGRSDVVRVETCNPKRWSVEG